MALIRSRRCTACRHEYDVIQHRGVTLGFGDDPNPVCPNCQGADFDGIVSAGTGIELGGAASQGKFYPRYDRALGMWLESAAHRRKVCEERGLLAVDGDFDETPYFRSDPEGDRLEKVWEDYEDRLKNSPEFAEARQLRAMGHPSYQWKD